MHSSVATLKRASFTNRAEARSGEALYWHPVARSFIAIPEPSSSIDQMLQGGGWSRHDGDSPDPSTAGHIWQLRPDAPVLVAPANNATVAHAIVGAAEQGYTLLTFTAESPRVHRRSASTVEELLRPAESWDEHDWATYPNLLASRPASAAAFRELPALSGMRQLRSGLIDNLGVVFWHQRLARGGLKALTGDALVKMRADALADIAPAWLSDTAKGLGINIDSKRSLDLLADRWLLSQTRDATVRDRLIAAIREHHPKVFADWSDAQVVELLDSGQNALGQNIRSTARKVRPTPRSTQPEPLDSQQMRGILSRHYGQPMIEALERAGMLNLVTTGAQLPPEVRALPNQHRIAGINIGGDQVYMVADRISAEEVPGLFLHEVGEHAALATMLGPDYGRMSKHFQKLFRDGDTYATWAAMQVPATTAPQHLASERLAYLIERVANDEVARAGGEEGYALGQKCLADLRTWLFRTPLCRWLDDINALDGFTLQPADMAAMAREAVNEMVAELDSSVAVDRNAWHARLDQAVLEKLFADPAAERQRTLTGLLPEQLAGYLFALASTDAPDVLTDIEHFSATLYDMTTGRFGEELSVVAGEVLALGYARENQTATAGQVERNGFGLWMENTSEVEKAQLKFLSPSAEQPGDWQLTQYASGLGPYHTEQFVSVEAALRLIGPAAFPVKDTEAAHLLDLWSRPPAVEQRADALEAWSDGTKAVTAEGKPQVFYHGTAADFSEFKGFTHWASATPELATEYANYRGKYSETGPVIMPVYLQARAPFDGDAVKTSGLTVAKFFNEAARQADADGRRFDMERANVLLNEIRNCSYREESGPYFSPHQFWNNPTMLFGNDGAASILDLLKLMGFDSIKFTEQGDLTYGVFLPTQLKSAIGNNGLFDDTNPDIRYSFGGRGASNACLKALEDAKSRHAAGQDAGSIWIDTGWHLGHDSKWRFEIDDSQAQLKENWNLWSQKRAVTHRLGDLIDHPPLFEAYQHLRYMVVTIDPAMPPGSGCYFVNDQTVSVYAEGEEGSLKLSPGQFNAVLHELQHRLQAEERFGPGANSDDTSLPTSRHLLMSINARYADRAQAAKASDDYKRVYETRLAEVPESERYREGRNGPYDYGRTLAESAAYDSVLAPIEQERLRDIDRLLATFGALEGLDNRYLAYRLVSGEVEARNVQTRRFMSAEERRAAFPPTTEDVPSEYVIAWHGHETTLSPSAATVEPDQTKAFREWFANSRVSGTDGKPRTLYQGGVADYSPSRVAAAGVYLSESAEYAAALASVGTVSQAQAVPVFVSIQRPWTGETTAGEHSIESLRAQGYDGIHIPATGGEPAAWIAFDTAQIKPAADTNGSYSLTAADVRYSFVGEKSKTALIDKLADARLSHAEGMDAEEIRQRTGWFLGYEGKWRFEIDDSAATLINAPVTKSWEQYCGAWQEAYIHDAFGGRRTGPSQMTVKQFNQYKRVLAELEAEYNTLNRTHRKLGDLLVHPDLFAAYPALLQVHVELDPSLGESGEFLPGKFTIRLGKYSSHERLLSVLMHETAHAVQLIEDFANGGDPARLRDVDIGAKRIQEINVEIAQLLDSNPAFGRVQRQLNRDFIAIQSAYGEDTPRGVKLNWDQVPQQTKDAYFALLEAVEQFPERERYWELDHERFRLNRDKPVLTAYEQYRHLAGEVEARNVQRRLKMNAAERLATPPRNTEDVAADAVIVVNGTEMSARSLVSREQRQTSTPAFQSWFEGSQLVDAAGAPVMLFHGTDRDLENGVFRKGPGTLGDAIYLTGMPNRAGFFASLAAKRNGGRQLIMPVYAALKNPWVLETAQDLPVSPIDTQHLEAQGYDGIIVKRGNQSDPAGTGYFEVAVFRPDAVKSAISNLGPVDSASPAMRFKLQHQTETPAFLKWFGASQVTEGGKPRVMYHGTQSDFSTFSTEAINSRFPFSFGFHFTDRPFEASIYADSVNNAAENFNPKSSFAKPPAEGGQVMPVYLRAENPLVIHTKQHASIEADTHRDEIVQMLLDAKLAGRPYDSVIIKREEGDEWDNINVIVLDGAQIKSAIGNVGAFEPTNPDIRFRQLSQTETPEFKEWFGQSGFVDENGQPLVLYHGTAADFASFDLAANRSQLNGQYTGDGLFFSADPAVASRYADASRNQVFNKAAMYAAVERAMPPTVAKIFRDVTELGYSPAWEPMSDAEIRKVLDDSREAGGDINDLLDLVPYVEGNRYDSGREGSMDAGDIYGTLFGGGRLYMDDSVRDMAVSLGLESALPNQVVMPVYLMAENILRTSDPLAASTARANGYDGVYYTGPNTVDGAPEYVVFDSAQVKSAIGNSGQFSSQNTDIRYRMLDQTETPEFKNWFEQSQITNEAGNPLVVYHGTERDFTAFETSMIGSATDSFGTSTGAFWFGADPLIAESFALFDETIMPVYLKMNRPLVVDCEKWARQAGTLDQGFRLSPERTIYDIRWFKRDAIALAKRDGYDGVVFKGGYDGRPFDADVFAAFEPGQIKSAIGNIGAFDPDNSDIRFRLADPEDAPSTLPRAATVFSGATALGQQFKIEPSASGTSALGREIQRSELASALHRAGRLAVNAFDGAELSPAAIRRALQAPETSGALRAFVSENIDALGRGEDVTALVRSHMRSREASIAALERDPQSDTDLQVRTLRAEIGWLLVNRDKFTHQYSGKRPALLDLHSALDAQPGSVRDAVALLGFDRQFRESSHGVMPTGEEVYQFLVAYAGGNSQADALLSSAGIDGVSYIVNQEPDTENRHTLYRVFDRLAAAPTPRAPIQAVNLTRQTPASTLAKLPGVGVRAPVGDTRQMLIGNAEKQMWLFEQQIQTFTQRAAWLARAPGGHQQLMERNDAALANARSQLANLKDWKAPGVHNTLGWDKPLTSYLARLIEPLGVRVHAGATGSSVFAELAAAHGSDDAAQTLLSGAGIQGVHTSEMTVVWDHTARLLAMEMECAEQQARFHLAFHGTPHTLECFSSAHINTGEGAQSFGHGLYFAQLESVARHYQHQHTRNGHWFGPERFNHIDDLAGAVVPAVVANNAQVAARNGGGAELDAVLRHVLQVRAFAPHRVPQVLSQQSPEVAAVANSMLASIRPISTAEVRDFFVMPAAGASALNAIDWDADRDFSFGLHHITTGLHWKLRPEMSADEVAHIFNAHLRERTDVLAIREMLEEVESALERAPEDDYWLSRQRDIQFDLSMAEAALKTLERFGPLRAHPPVGEGNLYTVNLDVRPEEYLQHDLPFSAQSHLVQGALVALSKSGAFDDVTSARLARAIAEDHSGKDLYRSLEHHSLHTPDQSRIERGSFMAEQLLKVGIQGIRYLDGGSRIGQGDSYNFVIFDDSKVRIVSPDEVHELAAKDRMSDQFSSAISSMRM